MRLVGLTRKLFQFRCNISQLANHSLIRDTVIFLFATRRLSLSLIFRSCKALLEQISLINKLWELIRWSRWLEHSEVAMFIHWFHFKSHEFLLNKLSTFIYFFKSYDLMRASCARNFCVCAMCAGVEKKINPVNDTSGGKLFHSWPSNFSRRINKTNGNKPFSCCGISSVLLELFRLLSFDPSVSPLVSLELSSSFSFDLSGTRSVWPE